MPRHGGGEDMGAIINLKQAFALVRTLVAVVLSLIIVLVMGGPYSVYSVMYYPAWRGR